MAKDKFDRDMIRDLAELLHETDLNESELESDGVRIRVSRGLSGVVHAFLGAVSPSLAT